MTSPGPRSNGSAASNPGTRRRSWTGTTPFRGLPREFSGFWFPPWDPPAHSGTSTSLTTPTEGVQNSLPNDLLVWGLKKVLQTFGFMSPWDLDLSTHGVSGRGRRRPETRVPAPSVPPNNCRERPQRTPTLQPPRTPTTGYPSLCARVSHWALRTGLDLMKHQKRRHSTPAPLRPVSLMPKRLRRYLA